MLVLAALICLIKVLDYRSINADSFDQHGAKTVFDSQTDSHRFTQPQRSPPCNQNESQYTNAPDDDRLVEVIYIKKGRSADDQSDFCLLDKRLKDYRGRSEERLRCELKASISNVFRPIKVYNISLVIFYDTFFEKKSHHVTRDLKYLIRGLQESYTSYDMINEIGLIKFYVLQIRRMNLPKLEVIDTDQLKNTFENYIQSQNIVVPTKAISVWFTRANLVAYEFENGRTSVKRIEGVANCDSFCSTNQQIVLVNCNSLNKAVITLSHEIAHILSSNHDEEYEADCPHDSLSFLMSRIYSPERNVFSAVVRKQIELSLTQSHPHCLTKSREYEFGYEEIQSLRALTLDVQCKFSYSNQFVSDPPPFESPRFCERLHCKLGLMRLSDFQVMNGTPCNRNPPMVCCFGRCMVNCTIFDHK